MTRFTLYGSPHSPGTYKVALMLALSRQPFAFRYVSFQKGMHKTPEFLSLSRWGQVPVLVDGGQIHVQSAAIVEHLADVVGLFRGPDPAVRQAVREWLYWAVDTLSPPILGCYGVELGRRGLLPIAVEPAIAEYHRLRAETALAKLDSHLAQGEYLFCYGDVAFAELCAFEVKRWAGVARWADKLKQLRGFKAPLALLEMKDAELQP
jgi:glutathione S-transferase